VSSHGGEQAVSRSWLLPGFPVESHINTHHQPREQRQHGVTGISTWTAKQKQWSREGGGRSFRATSQNPRAAMNETRFFDRGLIVDECSILSRKQAHNAHSAKPGF